MLLKTIIRHGCFFLISFFISRIIPQQKRILFAVNFGVSWYKKNIHARTQTVALIRSVIRGAADQRQRSTAIEESTPGFLGYGRTFNVSLRLRSMKEMFVE